jgi:hypothetical protein
MRGTAHKPTVLSVCFYWEVSVLSPRGIACIFYEPAYLQFSILHGCVELNHHV